MPGGRHAMMLLEGLGEMAAAGFEVIVVKDATAAAISPELGDGYKTALTNYGFIANEVVTTEGITARLANKM